MKKTFIIMSGFAALVIVILTFGCTRSLILLSPEDQFALGNYYLEAKDYGKASDQFEKIQHDYPTSEYATICQFKLAQTQFARKKYDEAAVDFELFLEFHPADKLAPTAQLDLALSKYYSMLNPERDVTIAKEALKELNKFLMLYPKHPDTEKVIDCRNKVEDHLFIHDFKAGIVYYRLKAYDSALDRIKPIIDKAHNPALLQESLFYMGRCYEGKRDFDAARNCYNSAATKYSDSKWARKSLNRFKKIKDLKNPPKPELDKTIENKQIEKSSDSKS
jgi:outer membrane protein assembly factor BamD